MGLGFEEDFQRRAVCEKLGCRKMRISSLIIIMRHHMPAAHFNGEETLAQAREEEKNTIGMKCLSISHDFSCRAVYHVPP